jgi:hypothetical protein
MAGASFAIDGGGFTHGSVVNFFVATAAGSVNPGPFTPLSFTSSHLVVAVPADTLLGQGVVVVQVVNTDRGFVASNLMSALLKGNPAAGIPSIGTINSVAIAADSTAAGIAVAYVQTVVVQGAQVAIGGTGFDTSNGVAVDLFCACPGGKVGPFFLNPGNPGLTSTTITLMVPAAGPLAPPTGPGSLVVSNKGTDGKYGRRSNAVSVPIGQRIAVTAAVSQSGGVVTVDGTGFSNFTVINLFNLQGATQVNLGGLNSAGAPRIPLTLIDETKFTFSLPAAAVPGPGYAQALNPPFVPFTSSGTGPGGSFTLK